MVPQRLIQIHRLEDRGIEASEELRGYDENLQGVVRISEAIEQSLFSVSVAPVRGVLFLATAYGHDDVGDFRW